MNAFQKIATRIVNAEDNMIETIKEIGSLTDAQARTAFVTMKKAGAFKLDAVGGRYLAKHGAFMDVEVIQRAAGVAQ